MAETSSGKFKGSSSKAIKPPAGPQRQHHRMASGGGLTEEPSGNSGSTGFEKSGGAWKGKSHKSGTSTGRA